MQKQNEAKTLIKKINHKS